MLSTLFIDSVQDAVTQSTTKDLCLVVYITDSNQSDGTDNWLKKWFQLNNLSQLKSMAVWLRLFKGSQELQYFEQIFPGVVIPSLYLIYKGQIKLLLVDDPNATESTVKGYWNQLFDCLKSCTPRMNISNINQNTSSSNTISQSSRENKKKKTFKQQVEETAQKLYREKVEKERRLDKEERERILRLVKADREERKAREHESHLKTDNDTDNTNDNDSNIHDNIKNEELLHSTTCVLQIKLTNGKSIRHTFDHKDTLNDVRKWVDLNRTDSDVPYAFHRSIPRYTFQESDELKTLESLELTPRSLLILKPLETSTNRLNISDIENPGLFGRVYNTFSALWGGYNNNDNNNNNNNNNRNNHLENSQLNPLGVRSLDNNDLDLNDNSIINPNFDTSIFGNRNTNNNINTTSNNNNISRSLTPNVFQFFNTDTKDNSSDDDDKEKETYNGNNTKLEKRNDD